MALLQISDPAAARAPAAVCGIDLGTTNSLVAVVRDGVARTLPDSGDRHRMPSVVRYSGTGVHTGYDARDGDPVGAIGSIKRLMGRGADDAEASRYALCAGDDSVPRVSTEAGPRTAVEISAELLRTLRARAEAALGAELEGAVITVPAYFDDAQRQATKDAARLAGIPVLRLINEPTAAAVAYGLEREPDGGCIAVFDLGGGTFDISILRLSRGLFEVLATGGDTMLGGDDFDRAALDFLRRAHGMPEAPDSLLLQRVRSAREALSGSDEVEIDWGGDRPVRLSAAQLEECSGDLLEKIADCCRRAVRDSGLAISDIGQVVLVGGMTRTPFVRVVAEELFGRAPCADIDPDRVVAVGAALQADLLAGNAPGRDLLLLDVLPLSLGIEIMGGLAEKILDRNTPIPARHVQEFTTFRDGQTALAIHVVQGERELVEDCRSLARFELRGIPPMTAGAARIRVEFQVDADGLLTVDAMEKSSGVHTGISVQPSYGLPEEEIERMLRDSVDHAGADVATRALREQQVEARRVLQALEDALAEDGALLPEGDERTAVAVARDDLQSARDGDDADAIRVAIGALEAASEPFVARRMNQSIREAMAGRRVEEFQGADS